MATTVTVGILDPWKLWTTGQVLLVSSQQGTKDRARKMGCGIARTSEIFHNTFLFLKLIRKDSTYILPGERYRYWGLYVRKCLLYSFPVRLTTKATKWDSVWKIWKTDQGGEIPSLFFVLELQSQGCNSLPEHLTARSPWRIVSTFSFSLQGPGQLIGQLSKICLIKLILGILTGM